MGATLRYAKVVDRGHLQARGGLSPRTENLVLLPAAPPAVARDFLVLRGWDDVGTGFREAWWIEDRHGHTIHTGSPRTVLAGQGDLADDVAGVRFEYADTGYQLVLCVEGREVARADFTVAEADDARAAPPPASRTDAAQPTAASGTNAAQSSVAGSGTDPASTASRAAEPADRELSNIEQRALDAVARLETGGTPGFVHDVAEHAELDLDTTRVALSGLTGYLDLVQEVPTGTGDDPDLGPRYRVKARP